MQWLVTVDCSFSCFIYMLWIYEYILRLMSLLGLLCGHNLTITYIGVIKLYNDLTKVNIFIPFSCAHNMICLFLHCTVLTCHVVSFIFCNICVHLSHDQLGKILISYSIYIYIPHQT